MDQAQQLLKSLPTATVNNSREIARKRMSDFISTPSDRNARALEDLGLSVDHDDYFEHYDEIKSHQ